MSKAIRWQVPFKSLSGIQYRVDIYDEQDGSWSGITQLTAGETPFTTEEDSSDNVFHPVRTQSGTLEVCTSLPNGESLKLEDILPANNIARPLRLISITTDNTETIEWQGFLSCEVYSQNYTSIHQNLSLPVISVLEAMASVQLDQSRSFGLKKGNEVTYNIIHEITQQCGMSTFTHVNYSGESWQFFNKYIDQTLFFEEKAYTNENIVTYIASGLSAKEALELICIFMGWTAREQGTEIYLEYIGEQTHMYRQTILQFLNNFLPVLAESIDIQSKDISTFTWMGTGHQRSVMQGAKSVEVIARISSHEFELKLPDFPFGDTTTLEWLHIKYQSNDWKYFYSLLNLNNDAYNNIAYGYYTGTLTRTGDSSYTATFGGASTKQAFLDREYLYPHQQQPALNTNPLQSGAILMRYAIEDSQTNEHDMETGLYCPLLPGCSGNDAPIFQMWTSRKFAFNNGKFVLSASMLFDALYRYNALDQQVMSDKINDEYINCDGEKLDMVLLCGTKYWTGSAWSSARTIFQVPMTENGFNIKIPVDEYMSGQVRLELLAGVTVGDHVNTLYEVIFKSLEVSFEYNEDYQASNRSENNYFRLLSTNFRDEIAVTTELASFLNNVPSPSIIMNNASTPASSITYYTTGGSDARRPEVDLLNRLDDYYSSSRQRLELEVKHPTLAPLPLMKLNGINDGKTYLPLAESRDWREEVSTLTCFEVPEDEASES